MQDDHMRLSWWLGRLRRAAPVLIVLGIIILYSRHGSPSDSERGRKLGGRRPTTEPPLPPPVIPVTVHPFSRWSRWVIIQADRDVCNTVSLKFPGWVVFIVGPAKPKGISFDYCVYKSADDLYVWRNKHIPEPVDSLCVNVLANLYAIKNGAEYIYLPGARWTEDELRTPVFPHENHTGLVLRPGEAFEPGDHFGCRTRNSSLQRLHEARYRVCTHQTPAIQVQMTVIVHPGTTDEDHAQKNSERDAPFRSPDCDPRAPPVTLPSGTLVQFEPSRVLYTKQAFWALPFLNEGGDLPHYKTLIWGMIAQKILWLSGGHLMVHSIYSTEKHKLSFPDVNTIKLTLEEWRCASPNLLVCVMKLIKILVEKQVIDGSIGPVLHEWLKALTLIGYQVPAVFPANSSNEMTCVSNHVIFQPVDYSQVVYRRANRKPYVPVNNVQELYATYSTSCQPVRENKYKVKINFTHPWVQFEDVLLVVTYNNPHYESLPYVETLYRTFFPYILHCGPGLPDFKLDKFAKLKDFAFSFYSYGSTKYGHVQGAFNYECVTSAINMHLPVQGYLVISDDMLLSVYKTFDLRRYLTWFLPSKEIKTADMKKMKECRLGMCDFYPKWTWWEAYQSEALRLLKRMEREQYTSPLVNRCYRQLMVLNGGQNRINGAFSDIYYIPERVASEFASLATLFRQEDVFLEIAIPSILRCLENTDEMEVLRGIASWDVTKDHAADRDKTWVTFTREKFLGKYYLHPTKWSYLANGHPKFKEMFCDKVLPYLHDRNGRLID